MCKKVCTSAPAPPSPSNASMWPEFPSPPTPTATLEAMEADVDKCLSGDTVVDPIVAHESAPALASTEPAGSPEHMDDAPVPPQPDVEDDDNAASQDPPAVDILSQQSESSLDLFEALAAIHEDSLSRLRDDVSEVGASSTCTTFSDQLCADQLEELLIGELPTSGTSDSDGESVVH